MPAASVSTPVSVPLATSWPFCTANEVNVIIPEKLPPVGTVPTIGIVSGDDDGGGAASVAVGAARSVASAAIANAAVVLFRNCEIINTTLPFISNHRIEVATSPTSKRLWAVSAVRRPNVLLSRPGRQK